MYQPISTRNAQLREKAQKPLRTSCISPKMSAMFANHKILFYLHMLSLRDLHFVLCSFDLDVLRKGLWAFYLNYPQINEVGKSDHVVANFADTS